MLRAQRHAHSSGNLLVADNVLWLTGNGSVSSGQLVDQFGNPISAAIAPEIFRTDWQGDQLLYPTARTNYAENGNAPGTDGTFTAASSSAVSPPASGIPVYASTCATSSTGANFGYISISLGANQVYSCRVWIYIPSTWASGPIRVDLEGAVLAPNDVYANMALTNQWQPLLISGQANSSGGLCFVVLRDGGTSVVGNVAYISAYELEQTASPGIYIPTTTVPVTQTDYALTGTTVNLAQAPASGALCNWSGLYIP